MKHFFTILFSIILFLNNKVNAVEINACEMSYQATANKNIYKVSVKVY